MSDYQPARLQAQWIVLTDANYGNQCWLRPDHITALTIVSETTYREGAIPDGVFRRTLIYTIGGSQIAARESPAEIAALIDSWAGIR